MTEPNDQETDINEPQLQEAGIPEEVASEEIAPEEESSSFDHEPLPAHDASQEAADALSLSEEAGTEETEAAPQGEAGSPAPAAPPQPLGARVETLERDMAAKADKTRLLTRVQKLREAVEADEALEDRDALLERLKTLEEESLRQFEENLTRKEALCVRAEELSGSTEWKATAEALKALQAEWKTLGPAPKDRADAVWTRFRAASNQFFERRKEHYDTQDKVQKENLQKKEALCVRAEELSQSTDWKATAEAFKALQEEWKTIGPAPKTRADAIWERFRGAANRFFEHRKEHYKELEKGQKENLRKKEALCVRAEELSQSTEWRSTVEAIKAVQAEWRAVGPAPKTRADAVWTRFRAAIDLFFARQAEYFEGRDKRQDDRKDQMREALTRKQEQLERLSESIQRDEENLGRWRTSLDDVTPGPRGDDIRESLNAKITDVETRRTGKVARRQELEAAIREIEEKL